MMPSRLRLSFRQITLAMIWVGTVAALLVGATRLQALEVSSIESPAGDVTVEPAGAPVPVEHAPVVGSSGIEGQVWIGPGCPGLSSPDSECSGRLSALTISVLAHTRQLVCQIQPDSDGRFRVALAAGTYTVYPELGPWINAPEQTVTVPDGQFAQIRIMYESGVR